MADASPTYRGYRKQGLYILWRVLCDEEELIYIPEHIEDLAVFRRDTTVPEKIKLQMVELVQVKDLSGNLSLSDFSPQNDDSFFYRVAREIEKESVSITIASYGRIGPELDNAIHGQEKDKASIAKKLEGYGKLTSDEAWRILDNIKLSTPDEKTLKSEISKVLTEGPTSPDPEIAFDLLLKWIWDCSENNSRITKTDLLRQIGLIGGLITERMTHCQEWGVSISSLDSTSREFSSQIQDEYREGIDAQLYHIQLGCDIPRWRYLDEISDKFKSSSVVIIHGASGQGKSSLAYRYLYESHPLSLCYEIKDIQNSNHAIKIARALSGYAKGLSSILIFLDVKPHFNKWSSLLRELIHIENIKVLVVVREEDFQIENISKATINYKDISLQLEKDEAFQIFSSFSQDDISDEFLSFEEAWGKFGGQGPLLEFIYLITQGSLLEERLEQQLIRLQQEIDSGLRNPKELELLRLISVASRFGASCSDTILNKIGLAKNSLVLRKLENEYLIKYSDGMISGLHQVRSFIISKILCGNTRAQGDAVIELLATIEPNSLYIFLINAFYECLDKRDDIFSALNQYSFDSWGKISSVLDSLLWLGIKEYVEENEKLLREIYSLLKINPSYVLDFDIAGSIETCNYNLLSMFKEMDSTNNTIIEKIEAITKQQTDKKRVFFRAEKWLKHVKQPSYYPSLSSELSNFGQICFWAARFNVNIPIAQKINYNFPGDIENLSISDIADFTLGLYFQAPKSFHKLKSSYSDNIKNHFQKSTSTVQFIDDEDTIEACYILQLDFLEKQGTNKEQKDKDFLNSESMYRINLLRKLFPDKKRFKIEGYGHRLLFLMDFASKYNSSKKDIPIKNLPLEWEIQLNCFFKNLSEYLFRPKNWRDYASHITLQRKTITTMVGMLWRCTEELSKAKEFFNPYEKAFSIEKWKKMQEQLLDIQFPKCAVDAWGFISETNSKDSSEFKSHVICNINSEFYRFKKLYDEYTRTWDNFSRQYESGLSYTSVKRISKKHRPPEAYDIIEKNEKTAKMSLHNLKDFVKNLSSFQSAFDGIFHERFRIPKQWDEKSEFKQVEMLWELWHSVINHPQKRLPVPRKHIKGLEATLNVSGRLKCTSDGRIKVHHLK